MSCCIKSIKQNYKRNTTKNIKKLQNIKNTILYTVSIVQHLEYFFMLTAVRRGYHRNAAYEKELRREEKRKAFRHRQRVHRFNKRISMKAKARKVVPPTTEKAETKLPEQNLEDATPSTVETDNSGTWEVKNTSTTLRNGKSKGVSMKILFKPQEQRRFRRRMRKRGTMRYGLKKTVSAPSRLRMQTKIFDDAGCSQGFSGSQMPCMDVSFL